jgi:hypothetical protein
VKSVKSVKIYYLIKALSRARAHFAVNRISFLDLSVLR